MSQASARKRTSKLTDDHMETLRRSLREILAEQTYSADGIDDAEVDDEWIDWVETYEEAIEGLERLGIDPYDDPMDWMEFLDPLRGLEPQSRATDEERFLEYLSDTYGHLRG